VLDFFDRFLFKLISWTQVNLPFDIMREFKVKTLYEGAHTIFINIIIDKTDRLFESIQNFSDDGFFLDFE